MRNSTNKRNFGRGSSNRGLKFLSSLYFTTIVVFSRAEISPRDENAPVITFRGADYMESFQPELSFKRFAEQKFQPG